MADPDVLRLYMHQLRMAQLHLLLLGGPHNWAELGHTLVETGVDLTVRQLALRVGPPLLEDADQDDHEGEEKDEYRVRSLDWLVELENGADAPIDVGYFGELERESDWEDRETSVKSRADFVFGKLFLHFV